MTNERKETVQYITAVSTLASGVMLCVLSFFLNDYDIKDSVLWYFGETCVLCGAIFGVSIYVRGEVQRLDDQMKKLLK